MDEEAAKANPFFGGRVAHGYLLLSFAAGLFVDPAPGPVLANYGLDNLRFTKPVKPGDSITVQLTAKSKTPRNEQYGEVRWQVVLTNQNGETVATYDLADHERGVTMRYPILLFVILLFTSSTLTFADRIRAAAT